MCIRKDIAEKKLQNANKDADERVARLQSELDALKAHHKKKEKEFEETMNHLQADIDALESERGELKDKVKTLSKRTIFEGLQKSTASPQQLLTSPTSHTSPAVSTAMSMSEAGYVQQIATLRKVMNMVQEENYDLKVRNAARDLDLKPPPRMPRFKPLWLLRAQGL